MSHQWTYIRRGAISDEQVGPIDEACLADLIRSGTLGLATQVLSPTRTSNQWVELRSIPECERLWIQGETEREDLKRREKLEQARQRQLVAQEQEAVARERQLAAQRFYAEAGAISDNQDPSIVLRIKEQIQPILTSSEVVQFIVVQEKPVVNVKPDAVIVTNRRLIFFRSKMLGRFDFHDYLWLDLGNAHLAQGMLGSTFSVRHASGSVVSMDYLSKGAAAKLYRIAQEREEAVIVMRRQRYMEERKAGASNIAIQANISQPPMQVPMPERLPSPGVQNQASQLIQRLETLKEMRQKELISEEEFQRRQQEIIAQV